MKTKHLFLVGTVGLALAGVMLTGCAKKKSTAPTNDDYTAAQDDANAQFAIQDSKNIADGAAKGQAADRTLSACWNVRKIPDTLYQSVHDTCWDINFGPTDCLCSDGRKRRGEVLVFWNGKPYFDSNSVILMTFRNYYVNDIGVSGTRTLTNNGSNTWGFTANLTLTYPNGGGTATWASTRSNTIQTISAIPYWVVSGSANGTTRKGNSFTITITSPLYATVVPGWLGGCYWIEAGKLTITVSSFTYPIYVDFGTVGSCDAAATATINSKVYNFTMW